MKKWMAFLLALLMTAVSAAALPNPWRDVTQQELTDAMGIRFELPESAENAVYRMLEAQSLAECRFAWRGVQLCMRISTGGGTEDISGLHCAWDWQEDCLVRERPAQAKRAADGEKFTYLCLWEDIAPGLRYSLSAETDAEFDILAAAQLLFVPVQGDADPERIDISALRLTDVLEKCIGYEGTAGASLKEAAAAYSLLEFAVSQRAADAANLLTEAKIALDVFGGEAQEELRRNLMGIAELIEAADGDFASLRGLFDSAGIADEMQALLAEESAQRHRDALWAAIID